METLPLFQVDAFSDRTFGGNPAAVVVLERWLADATLQKIAAENNLSETAFVLRAGESWELRWFTPASEVALCGHATLGAAHAIREGVDPGVDHLRFLTRQVGELTVTVDDDHYVMQFPAVVPASSHDVAPIAEALGATPADARIGYYAEHEWDLMAVFQTAREVELLVPSESKISGLGGRGLICTAPGEGAPGSPDFVSRCFYPEVGVLEDPVTGSAHCVMTPYWAQRLGKKTLKARQLSARGGELRCRLENDRVFLEGQAVTYLQGTIRV